MATCSCPLFLELYPAQRKMPQANINTKVETMSFLALQVSSLHLAIARDARFYICYLCNLDIITCPSLKHAITYNLSLCPGAPGSWSTL